MEIPKAEVEKLKEDRQAIKPVRLANGGIAYHGPWLPDRYFDSYTEALYANINFREEKILKEKGLNKWGQTPAQEKDSKRRQEESAKRKEKAAIAGEMLTQNK